MSEDQVNEDPIEVKLSIEFDDYGHPPTVGRVEVRSGQYIDSLVVVTADTENKTTESILVEASRDQWGVFYYLKDQTILSEDGTRSVLDALISGLLEIKNRNELGDEMFPQLTHEIIVDAVKSLTPRAKQLVELEKKNLLGNHNTWNVEALESMSTTNLLELYHRVKNS